MPGDASHSRRRRQSTPTSASTTPTSAAMGRVGVVVVGGGGVASSSPTPGSIASNIIIDPFPRIPPRRIQPRSSFLLSLPLRISPLPIPGRVAVAVARASGKLMEDGRRRRTRRTARTITMNRRTMRTMPPLVLEEGGTIAVDMPTTTGRAPCPTDCRPRPSYLTFSSTTRAIAGTSSRGDDRGTEESREGGEE